MADLSRLSRYAFSRAERNTLTTSCSSELEKQRVLEWATQLRVDATVLDMVLAGQVEVRWDSATDSPSFTKQSPHT